MVQCIARERVSRQALGFLLLAKDGYAKDVLLAANKKPSYDIILIKTPLGE